MRRIGTSGMAALLLLAAVAVGVVAAPAGAVPPPVPVGTITSFEGPGSVGLVTGPDGALWFTDLMHDSIARITTDGVLTTFTDDDVDKPFAITVGSDGALWFTNYGNGRIGRITTAGVLSSFPSLVTVPRSITLGSDGALWYAGSTNAIGRMTTAGTATLFTGANISSPIKIVAGPDDALWFTTLAGGIARITTDGVATTVLGTEVDAAPVLTVGPDGALWFLATAGGIGRVTTSGSLTTFPGPPGEDIFEMTAGPDGALWFSEEGSNGVGRIAMDGVVSALPVPEDAALGAIAAGPDGAVWFSSFDSTMNRMQVIGAPTAPLAVSADPGVGSAMVSWDEPAADGGEPVTGYTVTATPGGQTCAWSSGPLACEVSGLTNGTEHTFTVTATNINGVGVASAASAPVMPRQPVPSHDPFGVVDAATGGPGSLTVSGWAIDPDTSASIDVAVYVDGVGVSWFPAADPRPDVAAAFAGYGPDHGFVIDVPEDGGAHDVCVFAINTGPGSVNPLLGCRSVMVPTGVPFGAVDAVVGGPGSLTVSGWAIDPDTSASIDVAVYVDGVGVSWFPAAAARPDVAAAFAGYGPDHGFVIDVPYDAGSHSVCVFAINTGPAAVNPLLGCRTVSVT